MKTALTIGFFDGVHLGHQALLKALRKHPHTTIVTFSNHPKTLLNPPAPEVLIPLELKLEFLKLYADNLLVIPFTAEFAQTPFDDFLSQFDLSHIILGVGSVFGKNQEGNESNVRRYAQERGIIVDYVPKVFLHGEPVSSSRIRQAAESGDLTLAKQLLGKL